MNQDIKTLKVLLIAIDDYPIAEHRLHGCNNDISEFLEFLEAWVDETSCQLDLKTIRDSAATYKNVTTTFLAHFKDLKDGDIALVYYSGHGSQVAAPAVFWDDSPNPNRQHESSVLYDSRLPGGKDLLDKELAWMIWKVSKDKKVHFTVILDSCHSGSGTRLKNVLVRKTKERGSPRPLQSYLGVADYVKEGDKVHVRNAPHLLFSACQKFETAKESDIKGVAHGFFSYSLLEALSSSNGRLSYEELAIRTQSKVYGLSYQQYPQLEPVNGFSTQRTFLGEALLEKMPWSLAYFDSKFGWGISTGTLYGIPPVSENTATKWRIYPMDTPAEILKDATKAIGEVTAKTVFSKKTKIAPIAGMHSPFQYQAVLSAIATPRLKVHLSSESDVAIFNKIKQTANDTPSLVIEWVAEQQEADYIVFGKEQQIFVTKLPTLIPVFRPLEGYDDDMVIQLFKNLNTIAKWHQVQRLSHPYSQILDSDVSFEFYKVSEASPNLLKATSEKPIDNFLTKEVVLRYQYDPAEIDFDEQWKEPMFRLNITNTSTKHLWITALFLGSNFCIDTNLLSNEPLKPGESTRLMHYDSPLVRLVIEREWNTWDIYELTEHFKILVTTTPHHPENFSQQGLPLSSRPSDNTPRIHLKGLGKARSPKIDQTDWRSFDFSIKVVQPAKKHDLLPNTINKLSDYGLTIATPQHFSAEVRMGSTREASRLNRNLNNQAHFFEQSLLFSTPIGHSPALDVVELYDVKGKETIDAQHPLIIELDEDLADNERLIAYGYDEELGHFIPLGLSDSEKEERVIIEQLPDPMDSGNRSLGRALKIFFYKTALEKIGVENEYPILAAARMAADGETVVYEKKVATLKTRVAAAQRILILTHGIIGNTKEMVKATETAGLWKEEKWTAISDRYDLVLTFDYENLNTPLEETAQLFQKKLLEVGLDQNDGKIVHLMAHSMGGLVARWLVEKMPEHQLIHHLILIGTPNLGTTWAKVQHLAKWLLTFAFGKLTLAKPILSALAFLGSYADKTQVTFEQMNPSSEFLKRLNDGTPAPIPYTILAGNTNLIQVQQRMKSARFFNKIGLALKHHVWYKILDKAIFRQPNDVVVTIKSIFGVPASDLVKHIELESDHISYFWDRESLEELEKCFRQLD